MIPFISFACSIVFAETGPSTTPAFLSSQKRIKDVHDHAIDRLDIERQRERHGSHLQVKTVTAAGNHLIKLSKTGVRHICTSLNCKATKTEKESAKRQWDMAKSEGFSAAKAIRNHANHVVKNSAAEQKNIYQDILKIKESRQKGEEIPHEIQNRYNEVNNHHAANALAEEKSANWSQVQQRSRMARRL